MSDQPRLSADIYNASAVTIDGILENGRFNPRDRRNVQECATEAAARRWAADEMRRRA